MAAIGRWRSLSSLEPPPEYYLDDMLTEARASLPPGVVGASLASLRPSWRSGEVLFVHAGVDPKLNSKLYFRSLDTPLAALDEDRHWAWVRRPFLDNRPGPGGFSGFFVVHGHTRQTPSEGLARRPDRWIPASISTRVSAHWGRQNDEIRIATATRR